jgi:enoyl-CoA hydratase/carnithine racemase
MRSILNEPVLLRADDKGIATLTLNRGAKFNTLSSDLIAGVQDQLDAIANDPSIRVVVIAGSGKAFCAGHDLAEMRADSSLEAITILFQQCSKMMVTLTQIPQPVIARVHGMATAAGCQLVAQCDLAVAAKEATFATSGINLGLCCSTPMVAVTRNLPRKQAMELLVTGNFIDAETAHQYGLVNRVVAGDQLDDTVAELAANITSKSPIAIARGKELFYKQLESGLESAYELATKAIADNMQDQDTRTSIDAFIEKKSMQQGRLQDAS